MLKQWRTPGGLAHNVLLDMLDQPHLLIAGSTGSGKSVLINSLIYAALYRCPGTLQLVLIDPKRVELKDYTTLPHCIKYASEPHQITATLAGCVELMEARYKRFIAGQKRSTEPHIYIIIDEFADLIQTADKAAENHITRLARLGRAANMHLMLATQSPSRQVITAPIKSNLTSRVALRCEEAIESRQVINSKGAEALPAVGYGLYRTPKYRIPALIKIPMTDPADLADRVRWWTAQNK